MAPKRCPPGVWCFTPGFATISILIVALIIGIAVLLFSRTAQQQTQPIVINTPVQQPQPPIENSIRVSGDSRYNRAPEPLRDWLAPPDLRGALIPSGAVPIFQPPRGYPEEFQQLGMLTTSTTGQILPLFGRRTGSGYDRFNYYTRTDTFNPIQLPIRYQKRDCMEDIGCQEMLGGEDVHIEGLNTEAKVKVYRYNAPKYIPAVL